MVDNVQNQSVDFLGNLKKLENIKKDKDSKVMDYDTQVAIVELNKNYNKMVNNMFETCAKMCFKNFNTQTMNKEEKICALNCQKKFYSTYVYGQSYVNAIIEETGKTDIFSDKTEVDIIENARLKNKI
jgi:hypothetical protein